jgi:hypothetical protein
MIGNFNCYWKPSGTIGVTSTGTYGLKAPAASVTVGSITYPGPTPPASSSYAGIMDDRWIIFWDDLVDGDYTVQLADSGSSTQPDAFSFTVGLVASGVSIAHPANGATVKGKNVVAWGDSTHSITEAKLTVNGVVYDGTVLRGPSANRPYVIQFPKLTLTTSYSATLKVKNSNNDELTINLTVDP